LPKPPRRRLLRPHDSPALRLQRRLAREQGACGGDSQGHSTARNALYTTQLPRRRLSAGTNRRTGTRLSQSHRRQRNRSTDIRRVSAIRALVGDRLEICVGVDDAIVEGIAAGAVGWVAGLVNAFPRESVELFNLARAGRDAEAFELYCWFLPMLRNGHRAQVHPTHQTGAGRGAHRSARVRSPRLEVVGDELAATRRPSSTPRHTAPPSQSPARRSRLENVVSDLKPLNPPTTLPNHDRLKHCFHPRESRTCL